MAERQPSVSCARMESQFGINILHLPSVIHKAIYLGTGNYKLILLHFLEIKPVCVEVESFRAVFQGHVEPSSMENSFSWAQVT